MGLTEILSDVHADAATFGMTAPVGRDRSPRRLTRSPGYGIRYRR